METIIESEKIRRFVPIDEFRFDDVYGSGYVYGSGDGSGPGSGYGSGEGYGYGYGDGDGYGYGSGYGSGDGSGPGSGYGSGEGYGYGYGDGDGYGYGSGYGDGSGYGSGEGYGDGYGDGDGYGLNIEYFNGQKVYHIDNVPTLIDSVHGNYAKGRILNSDLTTKYCYVAKQGNFFAHGETLKQAMADVMEKYTENQPVKQRIAEFNCKFPDRNKKVPASELFSWHHILTGSCLMGRKHFCEQRGLDYENGLYTVNEFILLTKNAYGGEIIRQLEDSK